MPERAKDLWDGRRLPARVGEVPSGSMPSSYRCPGSARSVAGAPATVVASTPAATAADVTARTDAREVPNAPPTGRRAGSLTRAATRWSEPTLMIGVAASTVSRDGL